MKDFIRGLGEIFCDLAPGASLRPGAEGDEARPWALLTPLEVEDTLGTFFDNFLDISSAGKASQVDLRKVQKSRKMTEIRQDQHFDKGGVRVYRRRSETGQSSRGHAPWMTCFMTVPLSFFLGA